MREEKSKTNFMKGKFWLMVIIALFMGYKVFTGLSELIASEREKQQWKAGDREMLVNKCVKESGAIGVKYSELTRTFCECSQDKIAAKFTKPEYIEIVKKPMKEQIKISLPIIQGCLTEYQNALNQAEK